jgi:hypothetical protein
VAVLGGGKHEEGGGGELRGVAVRSSAEHEEARHCPASFGKGMGEVGRGKELEIVLCWGLADWVYGLWGREWRRWEIALARLF